ncbi:hypothetical protein ACFV2N_45690 [Streptomyces sp. NPDC059680]|uniref:hypothetical protein n=1 Tax=Streptomyces sp. NPDC059680 TaxID=3346904 RepID=UPI0036AA6BB7
MPYAMAAAFFVPHPWVRLGAVAALAAGVTYGGFVGPARSQQRQHEAEVAQYREHPELLYLGVAPYGMELSRAEAGPAYLTVEHRPVRPDELAYADLTLRPPLTPPPRCPDAPAKGETRIQVVSSIAGGSTLCDRGVGSWGGVIYHQLLGHWRCAPRWSATGGHTSPPRR